MDKYEYRTKMEQIERAKEKGDYQAAGKIAETMEWSRIKRVAVLCDIADIYDRIGKYNDCKDMLLMAYERSPIGRMIVYRLCEVCIKLREMDEAKEYFNTFLELAPTDPHKYILQYKIEKTQGASIDKLINILENLKQREFLENWAYELAYLYHKKGMPAQCVDECNEIFLWFGEGKYVEKALELKMLYEPLTQLQKERYEYSRAKRISEAKKANRKLSSEYDSKVPSEDELDISPVEVTMGLYNTINLQKELAKSLEQIMNATQKDDVTKTMADVKKLVEGSQIPELKFEEQTEEVENGTDIPEASLNIDFKNFLSEEYDGQLSLMIPDEPMVEKQITGQMSIEDVLLEWEKTKRAAEQALEADNTRQFENAKARAIAQTEGIMTQLETVIPQYEEADAKTKAAIEERLRDEALEEARLAEEEAKRVAEEEARKAALEEEARLSALVAAAIHAEEVRLSEEDDTEKSIDQIIKEEDDYLAAKAKAEAERQAELERMAAEEEAKRQEEAERAAEIERQEQEERLAQMRRLAEEETKRQEELVRQAEEAAKAEEEARLQEEAEKAAELERQEQEKRQAEAEAEAQAALQEEIARMMAGEEEKPSEPIKEQPVKEEPEKEATHTAKLPPIRLTEYILSNQQRQEFSYFMSVKNMEDQVCKLLCDLKNAQNAGEFENNHIIISGAPGMGKTKFAMSLVKVMQQAGLKKSGKFGKISAEKLNEKSVADIIGKVSGGCIVIEKASALLPEKAMELAQVLKADVEDTTVFLEDIPKSLSKFIADNFDLAQMFTHHISIPIFNNDELINFGKAYAKEQGYEIDEMGVLAMYNRIGLMQYSKQDTMLEEVMEIVDGAIKKSSSGFGRKFGRKKENLLLEKDFE